VLDRPDISLTDITLINHSVQLYQKYCKTITTGSGDRRKQHTGDHDFSYIGQRK